MAIYRGGMYSAPHDPDVFAWLVVTNNDWNEHMAEVAAIPIGVFRGTPPPHSIPIDIGGVPQLIVCGGITSLPLDELGELQTSLPPAHMHAAEVSLADLLDLSALLAPPARALPVVGSPAQYPRWGEIYYGPPHGTRGMRESKRYVVVSNNSWNAVMPRVVTVRLTTSSSRAGSGFPALGRGDVKACCGNVSAVRSGALDLRRRPAPPSLEVRDMVAIVEGIADTLEFGFPSS